MANDYVVVDMKSFSEEKWKNINQQLFGIRIEASRACGYCFMHGYKEDDSWEGSHLNPDCEHCEMFIKKVCVGPRLTEDNYEKYKQYWVVQFMDTIEKLQQITFKIAEEIKKDKEEMMLKRDNKGKWKKVKTRATKVALPQGKSKKSKSRSRVHAD